MTEEWCLLEWTLQNGRLEDSPEDVWVRPRELSRGREVARALLLAEAIAPPSMRATQDFRHGSSAEGSVLGPGRRLLPHWVSGPIWAIRVGWRIKTKYRDVYVIGTRISSLKSITSGTANERRLDDRRRHLPAAVCRSGRPTEPCHVASVGRWRRRRVSSQRAATVSRLFSQTDPAAAGNDFSSAGAGRGRGAGQWGDGEGTNGTV